MKRPTTPNPRLIFASVLLFAAFNYPFLQIAYSFSPDNRLLGVTIYLLGLWLVCIIATYMYLYPRIKKTTQDTPPNE